MLIAGEVNEALQANRYATKQPKWAGREERRGRRNGNELDRSLRYCWLEDKRRMYLVDKHSGGVRVVTSIRPEGRR